MQHEWKINVIFVTTQEINPYWMMKYFILRYLKRHRGDLIWGMTWYNVCFLVFIYFERERERESERTSEQGNSRERERERESQAGSTLSTESDMGLDFTNCEIITSAEIRSHSTDWATQAPQHMVLKMCKCFQRAKKSSRGRENCWKSSYRYPEKS